MKLTKKMHDRINWYEKGYIHSQYTRIVFDFKDYEKITRVKMLDEIYQVYDDPDNIIDICTVREIKYLKNILNKNAKPDELNDKKYDWEKRTLKDKFLIVEDYPNSPFIPEEIVDKVKEAVRKVDMNIAKKHDELNEIIVSYCKIHGSTLLFTLSSVGSALTELSDDFVNNHIVYNRVFNYYVSIYTEYVEELGDDMPIAIHEDFYSIKDRLNEERIKQGLVGRLNPDLEMYKTLFYNEFNIKNKKIKKFYEELQKLPFFWKGSIQIIKDVAMLNIDREIIKEAISNVPALYDYDLTEFFCLLDEAMDEMPSGALNGYTPNEAKKMQVEEAKLAIEKERKYIKQTNAHLTKKDADLFNKIYFSLLEFTNKKYNIKPKMKLFRKKGLNPEDVNAIINVFWTNKETLITEFCEKNPYKFTHEELHIAEEFKKGFQDICFIIKYEEEYTAILNQEKVYMIKGMYANIDEIIPNKELPKIVTTAIVPYKGYLICDGILLAVEMKIGSGMEKFINEIYSKTIKYYHL